MEATNFKNMKTFNNAKNYNNNNTNLICIHCGLKTKMSNCDIVDNCTLVCPRCKIDCIIEDKYSLEFYANFHTYSFYMDGVEDCNPFID
jgi:hypothetical protein